MLFLTCSLLFKLKLAYHSAQTLAPSRTHPPSRRMLSPRCFAQPRHISHPIYYPTVICSRAKRTSFTTSYINPAIRELNVAVREAEAVVIDEIDLDPGPIICMLLQPLRRSMKRRERSSFIYLFYFIDLIAHQIKKLLSYSGALECASFQNLIKHVDTVKPRSRCANVQSTLK